MNTNLIELPLEASDGDGDPHLITRAPALAPATLAALPSGFAAPSRESVTRQRNANMNESENGRNGDTATSPTRPAYSAEALAAKAGLAHSPTQPDFRFRAFQVDDLARAAMHDGLVLGWEPRMGKTLAAYVWPQLKGAERVLIVAPEQLHQQFAEEAVRFGITLRRLMSHDDFYNDPDLRRAAVERAAGRGSSASSRTRQVGIPAHPSPDGKMPSLQVNPQFWITSYSALGFNGGDQWAPKEKENGEIILNRVILARRKAHPLYRSELDYGIGESVTGRAVNCIRCVFQPTLAVLVADLFDCVECDEAVRIKSDATHCSLGVRELRPRFRLVTTATPIKNRLEDIFWLMHWACGGHNEATARCPYPNSTEAKETFANEHMLIEENHTKALKNVRLTGNFRKFTKRTPKICNIHRLWKLLGPVVLRRRKEDCGEDVVPKRVIPIRVTPGTAQQTVYSFHLANPIVAKNGNPMNRIAAVVAQLQNLRQAALCPDSTNLSEIGLSMNGIRELIQKARSNPDADLLLTDKAVLVANLAENNATPLPAGEQQAALAALDRMAATGKIDLQKIIDAAPRLEEHLRPFFVDVDGASRTGVRKHARSWTDHNPKQAAILKLIEELLSKGEQVVVMSPFQQFSASLYRRLVEANVSACLLDGNVSPRKRGAIAARFKQKQFSVLVAGQKAMGEGNSFECACNLILPSLDWAFDTNKQSIERVWGIVSTKPVTIYAMVTVNTIDERLTSVFQEKGDSSNLALDGRLFADKTEEINLGQLLADAIRDFNPAAQTIPEKNIEQEWNGADRTGGLRSKLRLAELRFREFHPPIAPLQMADGRWQMTGNVSAAEVRRAMAEISDLRSPISGLIACIPTATIGALIGTADRAKIDKARAAFSEFCTDKNILDWKQGWRAWEATGAVEYICKGANG